MELSCDHVADQRQRKTSAQGGSWFINTPPPPPLPAAQGSSLASILESSRETMEEGECV